MDLAGPINPTCINGHINFVTDEGGTFTYVGSWFTIFITITTLIHVTYAVIPALTYSKHAHGKVPALIHSKNSK